MGFDMGTVKDVGLGASTGGLYNVGKGLGLFDRTTQSQEALMDPAQAAARGMVADFARTGRFGDFQAGASIPLGYGDFSMTGQEQQGQSALTNLLNAGPNPAFRQAGDTYASMMKTDPAEIAKMMEPYAAGVQRQVDSSQAGLKRAAGAMGGLYSTDTIKGLGNIEAQGNQTIAQKMADLTNEQLDRSLSAAAGAGHNAEAGQSAALQQIQAAQEYGDLARSLNDASVKARDAELLRRRQELQLPLQAAEGLAGSNAQFGVPSVTAPSPFQQMLGSIGQGFGQAAGSAGAKAMFA